MREWRNSFFVFDLSDRRTSDFHRTESKKWQDKAESIKPTAMRRNHERAFIADC